MYIMSDYMLIMEYVNVESYPWNRSVFSSLLTISLKGKQALTTKLRKLNLYHPLLHNQ